MVPPLDVRLLRVGIVRSIFALVLLALVAYRLAGSPFFWFFHFSLFSHQTFAMAEQSLPKLAYLGPVGTYSHQVRLDPRANACLRLTLFIPTGRIRQVW